MNAMWFIYTNEVVSGPFPTEAVRAKIRAGEIAPGSFVWWKGQREWIPVATWETQADQIVQTAIDRTQKAVWYLDTDGNPVGPLTETELILQLRGHENLTRIRLWAVGMEKWQSVFELSEIMDQLGLSRRENERAPLMGTVAVTRSNEDPRGYVVRAASISVGGMGLTGQHDLRIGDRISLLIKSNEFSSNIHVRGEVAYVTSQGYVGVRFEHVHSETQAIIIDYVKRFNTGEPTNTSNVA
ncbi:MAG TPA: GYF domain-containing protein [Bdellovibrionales bacterium]|nr:GYF domain-containing protein [Bdellovibrionales bacterium]